VIDLDIFRENTEYYLPILQCLGKVSICKRSKYMSLLLERLEIKHPIFLAPMAGVSTPELAAEVSNQGGLGSLGLGANTAETARSQILKTQALTEQPFQVNFFCHQSVELDPAIAQTW
jgi:nitronate monooxygenase